MNSLIYTMPWVLASVFVGVVVGLLMGRSRGKKETGDSNNPAVRVVTKALSQMLGVAEKMANNIENHNAEIQINAQKMDDLTVTGEMAAIKHSLMYHVKSLMDTNKRLQEDLTCTRYRLEEQAQEIDHARREARSDALTGAANRRALDEKLHLLLDDWRRLNQPFVLLLADLDHFKRINDAHSHQAGDHVLQAAVKGLKHLSRHGDFIGRYGGDEFAILLPNIELKAGAEIAESIRTGISEKAFRVAVQGGEVSISLSIGVTVVKEGDTDESMLHRVDQALYRAKNLGRNQIQVIETDIVPATA